MMRTAALLTFATGLALGACSQEAADPAAEASSPAALPSQTPVPAIEDTQAAVDPQTTATASATPEPSAAVTATQIPETIRGRWGLVPADCTSKLGDAKGLVTISAGQLKFYESVAKLGKIKEAEDSRIRATFSYSGEGQTWTQDVVLDVQDGGKTLTRRDYGADALPGPLKYTRCS